MGALIELIVYIGITIFILKGIPYIINSSTNLNNNNNNNEYKLTKEQLEEKIKITEQKKEHYKKYLMYTNYFWVLIENIDLIPFHYDNIFNDNLKNKYNIIIPLFENILFNLPENFKLEDLKNLTTYRKSSQIIQSTLNDYLKNPFDCEYFNRIKKYDEKYSTTPNNNILDDKNCNSYLLDVNIFLDINNNINSFVNSKISIINNLDKYIQDTLKKANHPQKYDYTKCMNLVSEYETEQTYEILSLYYNLAILIVFYIYFNIVVDNIISHSELYNLYKKLKNEIHNDNYIVNKLFSIYNSLYKNDFDITFDNEDTFHFLIEIIQQKESIIKKDNFVNINESIFNIDLKKYINITQDNELYYKIINDINSNILSYEQYLSMENFFDITVYSKKYIDIFNEAKKQQALLEKNRILNGDLSKEEKLTNDILDYSNINNGYEFETYVANIYKMLGYAIIDVTSKSGDQGADVIVEKDGVTYAIQVKFYNSPVGNKAIQEIVAAKNFYKTDKAIVVTNNNFTKQAITLANANDVLLVDKEKLDKMIIDIKNESY